VKIFNVNSDEWDGTRDREGWRARGALVGQRIGGELIGATMSEVEPGDRLWPYHTHYLNEEWVIVLRGEPTLRTPEGEHVLKEGDVVCFPRGKDGAHQIINRTDSPIRVLMLSSMIRGEIIELPRHRKGSRQGRRARSHHLREARTHGRVLGRRGLAPGTFSINRAAETSHRREVIRVGQRSRMSPDEQRSHPQCRSSGLGRYFSRVR
jgi:uncharacterized cupin superfamily protein